MIKTIIFLLLSSFYTSPSSSFSITSLLQPKTTPTRDRLKSEILSLATSTNRGLTATPEQKDQILQLFTQLEKSNPTKKPLLSPKVNGKWSLEYTTSDSILGKGGFFPRTGPILQNIDTVNKRAMNEEVVSYFGLKVPRSVTAVLDPQNERLTNVQFKQFRIGPISVTAPEKFRGYLDVTYLDDDLRLTRGDKGNIFVLTRYYEE